MRSKPVAAFAVVCLAALATACSSVSPTASLTNEDQSKLADARNQALENNKTGQATNWLNSQTNNRGSVVPTRTYKSGDGRDCREFQQTITVKGETDLAYGESCRNVEGKWEIVSKPRRYRPGDYSNAHLGLGYGTAGRFGYPYYYGHRRYLW